MKKNYHYSISLCIYFTIPSIVFIFHKNRDSQTVEEKNILTKTRKQHYSKKLKKRRKKQMFADSHIETFSATYPPHSFISFICRYSVIFVHPQIIPFDPKI